MFAQITTYPAVGRVTFVDHGEVTFTAVLKVSKSRVSGPGEVSLWYSVDDQSWCESQFKQVQDDDKIKHPVSLEAVVNRSNAQSHTFTTLVKSASQLRFTVRYRHHAEQSWRWVREEQGSDDGLVFVKPPPRILGNHKDNLGKHLRDLNPDLKVEQKTSQTPETTLWEVRASIDAVQGPDSMWRDTRLGLAWGEDECARSARHHIFALQFLQSN